MANLEQRYADIYGDDALIAQQLLNQYNNESAAKQMSFQQFMSDTSHQREVIDLMKAGLNPVLSANAGAPAAMGAYSVVDSSPVSAGQARKLQLELQKNDLNMQYIIGKYAADASAAATRYAAGAAAAASMYGADQARASSLDVARQNGENSLRLAGYNWNHPSSAEAAAIRAAYNVQEQTKAAQLNKGITKGRYF